MGSGTRTKVLVVEDEPLLRMDAVDILEAAGFAVEEAADGESALRILHAVPDLHVLFTDVNMPGGMDGLALAHAAYKHFPSLGMIVVSGHEVPEAHQMPPGAVFVAKPYEARKIVMHVHGARKVT